jgi:Domain of unknown function (DUF4136)
MKFSRLFPALILAINLSGCFSIDARYSYDSETDFSGLKFYAWKSVDRDSFSTPESAEHYKNKMDEALAEKGFKLSSENPDFLILTLRVETYREKYKSLNGPVEFPKAMLRINFISPSSNERIYEAAASAYFSEDESQRSKNKIIDKAVDALLNEFPPDG